MLEYFEMFEMLKLIVKIMKCKNKMMLLLLPRAMHSSAPPPRYALPPPIPEGVKWYLNLFLCLEYL